MPNDIIRAALCLGGIPMKRVVQILISVILIFSFTACGLGVVNGNSTKNDELNDNADVHGLDNINISYWVAPNGNDSSSGDEKHPLATAQEALRRLRAESYDDATIIYTEGVHYLSEPISLEEGDHDITFVSSTKGDTIISGSVPISGWNKEIVNGIEMWVTQLDEGHRSFQSLYNSEGNLKRSRWPKEGFFFVDSPQDDSAPDREGRDSLGRYAMYVRENNIQTFTNPDNVVVKILHAWKDETLNISDYNPNTGRIELSKPSTFRVESGERFYYENVFEELSLPGEWYLNQETGKLYYIPMPDDILGETQIYGANAEQFLLCEDAENISFQSLEFSMGDWSIPIKTYNSDGSDHHQAAYDVIPAFNISNTRKIEFVNCTFSHINSTCLKFGYNVQEITVIENVFKDIGANAIFLVGQNAKKDSENVTRDFLIRNNLIDGYGQKFFNGNAVAVLHAASGEISNNEIHNGYSNAISLGWVWGYGSSVTSDILVKQNLIYDVGQNLLSDMGAIYTLGVKEGIVITENVIHDVKANLKYGYGGWGIYMDEGSSNVMITKNLVYDCNSTAFYQNYGRDNLVINNILALCGEGQVSSYQDEEHTGFHLIRNIIVSENSDFICYAEYLNTKSRMMAANNIYWDYTQGDRGIGSMNYTDGSRLFHNATFADPLFVNWEDRDFKLRNSSPAINLGFIPWDISQVGILEN